MNNTVTYQITVQPWQIANLCTIRLSRATYNKHGRQCWEVMRQTEARRPELDLYLAEYLDQVLELERAWRVRVGLAQAGRESLMSDPAATLGSDGGE